MRDFKRFALRFGGGLLVVFGVVFWSVSRDGMATADALAYATIGAAAVMTVVFVIVWGTALVGGWGTRRRALVENGDGQTFMLDITSSDDLQHHVRQLDGVPPQFRLPWGLTLAVSEVALGVWLGRGEPHEILRFPWEMVHSVEPAPAQRRADGEWCLNIEVMTARGLIPLRFPLMGSFPFGAQPASLSTATETAQRIRLTKPTTTPSG